MNLIKKGSTSNLTCDVCKINFNSNADYALHEFSKKHCDNLIRLAKHKPIVSKQKSKNENSITEKEHSKVNTVKHTGSFAKYGYFVPGEIYASAETSKEFNIDYDPYLQKFAENPFKERPNPSMVTKVSTICPTTCFSKKKKKKIKACQVCNVTFLTVPEYEAHMKSPQHITKLKVTGMGVSAHFVKASTDLHTTDISEEAKLSSPLDEQVPASSTAGNDELSSGPFPLLYCSDCELLLNSPQQYNAHVIGKLHIECAQKKAELKAKKEKLETPSPNQLYCYSCNISLNNLFQYNEHKNGKKHKIRCKNLTRKGITIPPEERVSGLPYINPNKPLVYPELYKKLVLEKTLEARILAPQENSSQNILNTAAESGPCSLLDENVLNSEKSSVFAKNEVSKIYLKSYDDTENQDECNSKMTSTENHSDIVPKIIFHKNCLTSEPDATVSNNYSLNSDSAKFEMEITNCSQSISNDISSNESNKSKNQSIEVLSDDSPVKCSLCNECFQWQSQLDIHLGAEEHYKKILEQKLSGVSDSEILKTLFTDRNMVKPNNLGKLTCSICNVTTDNRIEFDQHLSSIFHKYTEKDYRTKRILEVKHLIAANEQGLYFCKLCKEGWPLLVDYSQHLHFVKHKSIQRAQRAKAVLAKRRTSHAQRQRFKQNLRKKNHSLKRVRIDKNPGVRTKVCGVAVDLQSGVQAPIPNLEPLEPKIDSTKNISIGICDKVSDNTATCKKSKDNLKSPKTKRRFKLIRSNQKFKNLGKKWQNDYAYQNGMPAFMSSGNPIPPLIPGPSFFPRFPRPDYVPPYRNRIPYSSPCPPVFEPFANRPPVCNPNPRPPWFQRCPWPRYR